MTRFEIMVRSFFRRLGVNRLLMQFWRRYKPGGYSYEDHFDSALIATLRPDDVIWDIGANTGVYVEKFLEVCGRGAGSVVAFEPAPECFRVLANKFGTNAKVKLENVAVGAEPGRADFSLSENPLDVTHQIVPPSTNLREGHIALSSVELVSGDDYVHRGNPVPSVVKIDVEGFEEEVMKGMPRLLTLPQLRAVFCEVHFGELARRGEAFAPVRIERTLIRHGFNVKWVDSSHIVGIRDFRA